MSGASSINPLEFPVDVVTRRHDGRRDDALRALRCQKNIIRAAPGSAIISYGNTEVICAVTVEKQVPRWMKEQGVKGGWLTAEYSMLPYATESRKPRDISKGKVDGRSVEIQRLVGRSLRACVDLENMEPITLAIDCDVMNADGGTRTAAITGSYIALALAVDRLIAEKTLKTSPIRCALAAVSVGIVGGRTMLDLDYIEDRDAKVDMNVVMNSKGQYIEIQASGEEATFSEQELQAMLSLAKEGIKQILAWQDQQISIG